MLCTGDQISGIRGAFVCVAVQRFDSDKRRRAKAGPPSKSINSLPNPFSKKEAVTNPYR